MLIAMEKANPDVQPIERDTWQPLMTASAQLLRRLHAGTRHAPIAPGAQSDPHENIGGRRDDRAGHGDNRYVSHRLKEIAAFEERASGRVPRRRKRKI
jgi:hypothetical protein